MPAILNFGDLAGGDNSADDRVLPIIISGNQCPVPSYSSKSDQPTHWEHYMEVHRAQGQSHE